MTWPSRDRPDCPWEFRVNDVSPGDLVLLADGVRLWQHGREDTLCGPRVLVVLEEVLPRQALLGNDTHSQRFSPTRNRTHVYLLDDGAKATVTFTANVVVRGVTSVRRPRG